MLYNKIFDKSEICYGFITSYNQPNILIPCKCIIMDVQIKYDNPSYIVKLEKLYDDTRFLKKHLYNMMFYTKFNQKGKNKIPFPNFKTIHQLNDYLSTKQICVVIEGLLLYSSKIQMNEAFNKLNEYLISLNLYNLKTCLQRDTYNGKFKLESTTEFNERFSKFIGDKFSTEKELHDFLFDIERSKPINAKVYPVVEKAEYKRDDKRKDKV